MVSNSSTRPLWLFLALALALAPPAFAGWKTPREALDQREFHGSYALYYTLMGSNAVVPQPRGGGYAGPIPEVVERRWASLDRAERAYREGLGLRPPLEGERYREGIGIDLHMIDLGDRRGSTGDELQHFDYRHFGRRGPVLTIALTNRWAPPSLTPPHELFHAYQYGYTRFKNRWFLEGTARLAENLASFRGWRNEPLPRDQDELERLLQRGYSAEKFWNRLALLCDPDCERRPFGVEGAAPCGRGIIKPLLERFEALDKRAARDRGIDPADWPEKEQRSSRNDPYLLLGVKQMMESACPLDQSEELAAFHRLLSSATASIEHR